MRARLVALLAAACAPLATARRSELEAPSPRELEAMAHAETMGHTPFLERMFVPGADLLSLHRTAEGATLATIGSVELAGGIAAWSVAGDLLHPAATVPLLGWSDLIVFGDAQAILELERARQLRFTPQDTPGEIALAPWNGRVLARPEVFLGVLGLIGASLLVDRLTGAPGLSRWRDDPNLFGPIVDARAGDPIAFATGAALFEQVATAEESIFRGVIQSALVRSSGETAGWIYGSLIFGGFHATNAIFASSWADARQYLEIGVPFITLIGSYLGLVYRIDGYSLAPSTAIHFWYDLGVSAIGFFRDPRHSPLSASITIPF